MKFLHKFHCRTDGTQTADIQSFMLYPDNSIFYSQPAKDLTTARETARDMIKTRTQIKAVVIYGYRNGKKIYIETVKNHFHRT